MKNILLILLTFFSINSAFAQYEFSDVTGIYRGYLHNAKSKDLSHQTGVLR